MEHYIFFCKSAISDHKSLFVILVVFLVTCITFLYSYLLFLDLVKINN